MRRIAQPAAEDPTVPWQFQDVAPGTDPNAVRRAFHRIRVRPIAGALGAEIEGVDLAQPLDEATVAEIRLALLDHLVIFLRDQELTPEQLKRFGGHFGAFHTHAYVKGLDGHPEIMVVAKEGADRFNFGGEWHSDVTFEERPPLGSILYAKEVPDYGGDTLFANMYLAYETLSPGLRRMLAPLTGVSSSRKADASATREDRRSSDGRADAPEVLEAEHPVVRTHPETGRKALYVNVGHTVRFKGMTAAESAPILEYLFRHIERPEFHCRFRWSEGAMALWDNRCTQHYPVNDYHGFRRVMHRITLRGDRPA